MVCSIFSTSLASSLVLSTAVPVVVFSFFSPLSADFINSTYSVSSWLSFSCACPTFCLSAAIFSLSSCEFGANLACSSAILSSSAAKSTACWLVALSFALDSFRSLNFSLRSSVSFACSLSAFASALIAFSLPLNSLFDMLSSSCALASSVVFLLASLNRLINAPTFSATHTTAFANASNAFFAAFMIG